MSLQLANTLIDNYKATGVVDKDAWATLSPFWVCYCVQTISRTDGFDYPYAPVLVHLMKADFPKSFFSALHNFLNGDYASEVIQENNEVTEGLKIRGKFDMKLGQQVEFFIPQEDGDQSDKNGSFDTKILTLSRIRRIRRKDSITDQDSGVSITFPEVASSDSTIFTFTDDFGEMLDLSQTKLCCLIHDRDDVGEWKSIRHNGHYLGVGRFTSEFGENV